MSKVIDDLIENLKGTCTSIDDYVDEDLLTTKDLEKLDAEIFLCEGCSWWCEVSEMVVNQTCEECSE